MIERLNAALEGRYRIERELGAGGMATVYLAEDLKHQRRVAIKVLRPELAAVVGADRFLTEIRTTANLQHPHILPLFDSGEAGSFLYYVMPYMAGETLRDRIDREKQLPVDEAVAIATKVASALAYAHRNGVIHRDIKPANILLEDGEPQVADFGIALAVQQAGGGRLTETGLSLGTPYYMSPEQATGDRDPDPRSDLYSLGCVAFEMLAGEPPFSGNTAQSVLAKILTDDAPLVTKVRKSVPLHVASAVACATQRLPADRFADVAGFISALNDPAFRWGDLATSGGASGATGTDGRIWQLATAALAVVSIGLAALLLGADPRGDVSPLALRVNMPDSQRILNPNDYLTAVLSDDGSTMVYTGPAYPSGEQLWVKRRTEANAVPIPGTGSPQMFIVSPDGSEVAYVQQAGRTLNVVSTTGGTPRVVADSLQTVGGDWAEDGWIYFQNSRSGISRVQAIGGPSEPLSGPVNPGIGDMTWPEALPGGEKVVLTVWGSTPASDSIAILDVETREITLLTSGVRAQFLPPDQLLVSRNDQSVAVVSFDPDEGRLLGTPRTVLGGVRGLQSGALDLQLNGMGTLLYVAGGGSRGTPVWVDREGNTERLQDDWLEAFVAPSLSPDGSAVALGTVEGTRSDMWVRSTEVGDVPPQRLSFQESDISRSVWSVGGDSVLYVGKREDARSTQLLARRADGTGEVAVLLDVDRVGSTEELSEVEISPDGRYLVIRVGGGITTRDILLLERGVDTVGRPLIATPFNEHSPSVSPDGRYLVHVSNESGIEQVYVRTFPDISGGKWLISSGAATEPVWAPDGGAIFYRDAEDMLVEATWVPGRGVSGREVLFDSGPFLRDPVHPSFDVHPDGRFLMVELADNPEVGVIWVENFPALIAETGGRR